jgi:hypothetical protein
VGGVVATGAVFAFLVQVNRFTFLASPVLGTILAGVSIGLLGVATVFLRRRIPQRSLEEPSTSYWAAPENRGTAIVLWAVTEGAALLGLIGYLVTGALAPAVAAGIAGVALIVFRPSQLEGAA